MTTRIEIVPGFIIELDDKQRQRLRAELADPVNEAASGSPVDVVLAPDHPMWDHHSGGDRHAQREFSDGDEIEARATRGGLSPKASVFFEELLTLPGHLFSSQHFIETFPDVFESPAAVAGCLNGFTRHCERADRSYPFYWWEGRNGSPTRYAIHPHVARVFIRAGK